MSDIAKVIERRRSNMNGETHYIVAGKEGSIDFHVFDKPYDERTRERVGGVEYHYRSPPDYMSDKKPSHETCWAMIGKGPCWHDGTSLWASEHWIPLLDMSGEGAVFRELEDLYVKTFSKQESS